MSIKSKVFAAAATLTLVGGVGSVRVLWYAATPALPAGEGRRRCHVWGGGRRRHVPAV